MCLQQAEPVQGMTEWSGQCFLGSAKLHTLWRSQMLESIIAVTARTTPGTA